MTTIRVDPSRLRDSAHAMARCKENVDAIQADALRVTSGAPSYDGQFGPQVQAIGDEAVGRLRAVAAALEARHDFLMAKANAFEAADQETLGAFARLADLLSAYLREHAPALASWAALAGLGDDITDEIRRLLSYSLFDWTVTGEEERRILELLRSSDLSQVIRELDSVGMLDALLSRVNVRNNRRDLLRLLGAGLDDSARALVEPHIRALGQEAELQYNLARLGVDFSPADFDRSPYAHLVSSDPGQPFTGVGASGENPTTQHVPLGDQILLALADAATVEKYSNPLGALNVYLEGLTAEQRRGQVELLVSQPISTVMPESYGGELPSRGQIIMAAAWAHNIEPELLTAFILAEQRDQTLLEDAKDYVAAVSIAQGNTSIGLGQVVVSTARDYGLFRDLLSAQAIQDLSHNDIARLLASDEFNIFATASYIRTVADQGAGIDLSAIPHTHQAFPGLDLQVYSQNSATWPPDNIRALASEYTTLPWDNGASADSPGWGYFVFEAYQDVVESGVFR